MDTKRFGVSRRDFLRMAGGATGFALFPMSVLAAGPSAQGSLMKVPIFSKRKAKVDLVFIHPGAPRATWPTKDYDYVGRRTELERKLKDACPGIDFTTKTAHNPNQAEALVQDAPNIDGYLVYQIGLATQGAEVIARSGKPVVMVDDLYGGTAVVLRLSGAATREKLPLVPVCSDDFKDVVAAARYFEVIRAMKESTILAVADRAVGGRSESINEIFGSRVVQLKSDELASYYERSTDQEGAAWADVWMQGAKKVVEPTRDELIKSGRMHLALCRAAADKRADAVTMDCLGMFYSGRVTAYPCLSFFQMNNEGGTGVCECDLKSTCTQLMMRYLTGQPGYVSDPVIDTSRDEIVYAHCVATNRVFGPKGKANDYIIRSHAEDEQGASVQSLMPLNEEVTSLVVGIQERRMVIHTGRTSRNVNETKACRTKLAAKANTRTLLKNWDLGWHRVTVYGDWREQAMNLARLYGMEVFEEDKA